MKNYVQPGESLDLTAPSGGVVSGSFYKIGVMIVCAAATVAQGQPFAAYRLGVYDYAKATGQVWAEGALLYWDDTAKNFTTTVGSNTKAGVAAAAAVTGAATGRICLVPII